MTVEIISWSVSTKVWDRAGIELATPGSAVRHASIARLVTDCAIAARYIFQGGPTFSRGGGVKLLIPYRNPYYLWFSRGGPDPLSPPLDPHLLLVCCVIQSPRPKTCNWVNRKLLGPLEIIWIKTLGQYKIIWIIWNTPASREMTTYITLSNNVFFCIGHLFWLVLYNACIMQAVADI